MTHQDTQFASDVAALRFMIAPARLELKYRSDQRRLPKGQTGGGQFADEGRGRGRARGFVAPAIAATRATTAATAGAEATLAEGMAAASPGAAALAVGAVAISRTAGLATQAAQGGGVTPILGIPYQLSTLGRTTASGGTRPPVSEKVKQQCDAAYDDDISNCYSALGLKRGKRYKGNKRLEQCFRNEADRLAECLTEGNPYDAKTSLLAGVTY